MILGQRLVIPAVAEHDPLVIGDQLQVHRLIETVIAGDDQVASAFLYLRVAQQLLRADAGPLSGADQGGAHPARNTGKGDKLVAGLVVIPDVIQGQH